MKSETVEERAVAIAAYLMAREYVCIYDDVDKCRKIYVNENTCEECIRKWLLRKARKELGQ